MTLKELDKVTVQALREGSIEAYILCYDLYFSSLCAYANAILKQPFVAEEIVQNIFVGLWIDREKLPENIPLKGYLFRAVRNDCLDHHRHRKVRERYESDYLRNGPLFQEEVFDLLVGADLEKYLQTALEKLPPTCRKVFHLSRFEFRSYKEIAQLLEISVKTVENHMGKALRIVREELAPILKR